MKEIGRLCQCWDDKLVELQGIADGYGILENLGGLIVLQGKEKEDERE